MLVAADSDSDFEVLAERNYECFLDLPEPEEKKLDFWQLARLKEEEEIKNINFEQYAIRQAELEAEEAEYQQTTTDSTAQQNNGNISSALMPA